MRNELKLENLFFFLEMGNDDGWKKRVEPVDIVFEQKLTFWQYICGIIRPLPFAWNFNRRRDLRP